MINSAEAMSDDGHIHIAAQVDKTDENMVQIRLINNGPPIPPDHMERIFDPFFTTKPNGTGLGLFISYGIIEQHNGTISVENRQDGQGVVFTLTLPIALSVDGQAGAEMSTYSEPAPEKVKGTTGNSQ
jgi:signal transduction histidine kinase